LSDGGEEVLEVVHADGSANWCAQGGEWRPRTFEGGISERTEVVGVTIDCGRMIERPQGCRLVTCTVLMYRWTAASHGPVA